jgi:hypothetical protein
LSVLKLGMAPTFPKMSRRQADKFPTPFPTQRLVA